ncbi:MAG TPA: hypothetical protein VF549_15330 [Solirubrobacteraceae bacterium]
MRRLLLLAAVASLAAAAPAAAATRYAGPAGSTTGDCLDSASPCSLAHANEAAAPGDTIRLLAGTYSVTGHFDIAQDVSVEGAPGPRPSLDLALTGDPWGVIVQDGTLRHVAVSAAGNGPGFPVAVRLQGNSTLEDATVIGTGQTNIGVGVMGENATVRNVVVGAGGGTLGTAISVLASATIDHATALGAYALFTNGVPTVNVRNTILVGSSWDWRWSNGPNTTVNLVNSRIATMSAEDGTGEPPGARTDNVSQAALLTADGHEQAGSPTIDAGTADGEGLDIDGDARVLGARTDIGADELASKPYVGPQTVSPGSVKATLDAVINAAHASTLTLHYAPSGGTPAEVTQTAGPGAGLWQPVTLTVQPETTYDAWFTASDPTSGDTEGTHFQFTTVALPATTVTGPASTTEPRPTFSFVATPAAVSFTCRVDTAAPLPCTSPWRVPAALSVGAHTITVEATDEWGGHSEATHEVTIEPVPPVVHDPVDFNEPKPPADTTVPPADTGVPPPTGLPVGPIAPPVGQVALLAPKAGKPTFRKGRVRVPVTNPNATAAKVVGTLKRGGRTLARGSRTLAGGAKGTLVLTLTRAGRKAAKRKLKGTVTLAIGTARTTKTLR